MNGQSKPQSDDTKLNEQELRKKVTLALATGAHFYGTHMQKQVEDQMLKFLSDNRKAVEIEAKIDELELVRQCSLSDDRAWFYINERIAELKGR
jgi:hypothetical protein